MDVIKGLPKSKGNSFIIVVVDRLTNYAHFCALSHHFKVNKVGVECIETIQNLHVNPKIIITHIDPIFTRKFWMKLVSCLCTKLSHISSYHPQYDGKTKILNKCLEGYLCFFVSDKKK